MSRHHLIGGLTRLLVVAFWVAMVQMHYPGRSLAQAPGLSSPTSGQSVRGDVLIQGTAVIEPFQKYELHFKQEPSGDDAFIYFDGGTQPVVNGQLGIWRASGLPPGTYTLRLRVVKQDGNYAEYYARNISLNQQPLEPTATATSDVPTPTPIPTATFTPVPQPTPIVGIVEQPPVQAEPTAPVPPVAIVDPAATGVPVAGAGSSPEPASVSTILSRQLGEALSLDRLRSAFGRGVRFSATVVAVLAMIFSGKALYGWLRSRVL